MVSSELLITDRVRGERATQFATVCVAFVFLTAILAGLSPIAFAIITVSVFGAPHNFSELRFFLSKLPSRLATLKPFFAAAFSGTIILFLLELCIMYAEKCLRIPQSTKTLYWMIWNQLVLSWLVALAIFRYRLRKKQSRSFVTSALPILGMATFANVISPLAFTYVLTYLHPTLSLWIFDRELRRSAKSLLPVYHKCLTVIPLVIVLLAAALWNHPSDSAFGFTLNTFVDTTDSTKPPNPIPVKVLLAVFVFLQMIHYGVWCFGIPIISNGWRKWRLDRIAVLRERPQLRHAAFVVTSATAVLVPIYWIGFCTKYDITNEVYIVLGTFHVLAEVPFMFWMLES